MQQLSLKHPSSRYASETSMPPIMKYLCNIRSKYGSFAYAGTWLLHVILWCYY